MARGRLWKVARAAAIVFCGAAALTALVAAFVFPAAAAVACPQCYGFDELAPGVFLEDGTPAAERSRVEAMIA